MKATRIRTLRGSFKESIGDLKRQLILDDGRHNHGLKILSFKMWTDQSNADQYISASLSLDTIEGSVPFFDAEDNRQIAWFTTAQQTTGPTAFAAQPVCVIDPNHIVNEGLFLRAFGTANVIWSYLITAEEYDLTDDEAVITLIKERSQNFD
jgi:hypothetical protein